MVVCRMLGGARGRPTYTQLRDQDTLPEKVWLYPEEGWARTCSNSHLLLKTPWWSRRHCYVLHVEGTRRHKTVGRVSAAREGEVVVEGSFRGVADGDFRLVLTSTLTPADLRRGYHMTGSLERGTANWALGRPRISPLPSGPGLREGVQTH